MVDRLRIRNAAPLPQTRRPPLKVELRVRQSGADLESVLGYHDGTEMRPRFRRSVGKLAALAGILSLFFGAELLIPQRSLYRWDTLVYTWPLAAEVKRQILTGHWPFWTDGICCGTPLLGNPRAAAFYPLNILWILLPLKVGYHLFLLAHVYMIFLSTLLLLRHGFRLSLAAALAGALAFGASGYVRAMWDTHNFAALPWILLGLWAVTLAGRSRTIWGPAAGLSLVWSLMLLTGQWAECAVWIAASLALLLLRPNRRTALKAWVAGTAVGTLLAVPQLLPALETVVHSYRLDVGSGEALERSLNPLRLAEFIVPHIFGTHQYWQGESLTLPGTVREQPWAASIHVGVLSLCVISCVGWRRKCLRSAARFGLYLALGSLVLALGGFLPPVGRLLSVTSGGLLRYPERMTLWTAVGLSTLTALGVNRLRAAQQSAGRRPRILTLRMLQGAVAILLVLIPVAGVIALRLGVKPLWILQRCLISAAFLAALALVLRFYQRPVAVILLILIFIEATFHWFTEAPTARVSRLLATPVTADIIRSSSDPRGRYLCDPALSKFPMEVWEQSLPVEAAFAISVREKILFNTALLWEIRSCHGYSPVEDAAMHMGRHGVAGTFADRSLGVRELLAFIRKNGVRWLLTSRARTRELTRQGLSTETVRCWGPDGEVTLLHLPEVHDVEVSNTSSNLTSQTLNFVWHRRPGWIRIDLFPYPSPLNLKLRETWAPGWTASDERGRSLTLVRDGDGMISVTVPPRTARVFLTYRPLTWTTVRLLFPVGVLLAALLSLRAIGWNRTRRLAGSSAAPLVLCAALFVFLGVSARDRWSPTMDESFHLVRGLARLEMHDARLSYLHPPLANVVQGYFTRLAYGSRRFCDQTPGWRAADSLRYAVETAYRHHPVWIEAVRAARWANLICGLLLIALVIQWARKDGGLPAAWLAAMGTATLPLLLAHGNLATADVPFTLTVVGGTWLLCRSERAGHSGQFLAAGFFFVLASLIKFVGLLWLLGYLLIAPVFARRFRSPSVIRTFLAVGLFLLLALTLLYGLRPYELRTPHLPWINQIPLPFGRYLEGILGQTHRAIEGDRAYFAGRLFASAPWWILPVSLVLKTPPGWSIIFAALLAVTLFRTLRGKTAVHLWPLPAALAFAVTVFCGHMAMGARYLLWLTVLLIPPASSALISWSRHHRIARTVLVPAILIYCLVTALTAWPRYIDYFPRELGGPRVARRLLSDSNIDWGQDLDLLEQLWPAVVRLNNGNAPYVAYFGFLDPEVFHHLPCAPGSLLGYCGQMRRPWHLPPQGTHMIVASHSALTLHPFGWTSPFKVAATHTLTPTLYLISSK